MISNAVPPVTAPQLQGGEYVRHHDIDERLCALEFRWPARRTSIFAVCAWGGPRNRYDLLGQVRWYAQWRRFVFECRERVLLDPTCLRAVAGFCESRTRDRKDARRREIGL